jgi:two-component system response regulator YesN
VEAAKTMLQDKKNKLHEIAPAIGYNDPHYFSYVFKKNTGVSPKEYRNSL